MKQEMINFQCWLQGYYNNIAIVSGLNENVNYLSKPIELNVKPKSQKEEKSFHMKKIMRCVMYQMKPQNLVYSLLFYLT